MYCEKVFIMSGSDDWNPHWKYFETNENAMTNFEGDIVEDERRTDYAMEISDDNYMFQ